MLSQDADLLHLTLLTHEPHFTIIREGTMLPSLGTGDKEKKPATHSSHSQNGEDDGLDLSDSESDIAAAAALSAGPGGIDVGIEPCVICGSTKHTTLFCPSNEETPIAHMQPFILVDMSVLRQYLFLEFADFNQKLSFQNLIVGVRPHMKDLYSEQLTSDKQPESSSQKQPLTLKIPETPIFSTVAGNDDSVTGASPAVAKASATDRLYRKHSAVLLQIDCQAVCGSWQPTYPFP